MKLVLDITILQEDVTLIIMCNYSIKLINFDCKENIQILNTRFCPGPNKSITVAISRAQQRPSLFFSKSRLSNDP